MVSNLIVDHNVDAAADSVVRQARHVERLHDNPLPGKAAVAVEEEGHRFGAVLVAHVELLCTHLAELHITKSDQMVSNIKYLEEEVGDNKHGDFIGVCKWFNRTLVLGYVLDMS